MSLWREEFTAVQDSIRRVRAQMQEAAIRSGRDPKEITMLAATKTVPPEIINCAIESGVDRIGENRVQELLSKIDRIDRKNTPVDLIGHLQTNKVSKVLPHVSMIHSVDSYRLAEAISEQSQKLGKTTDILVEVNIGHEECKSGIAVEELLPLLDQISQLPHICVKGLMTIPPICEKIDETRKYFSNMYQLFLDIKSKNIDNIVMQHLSMGMSADFAQAIEFGSTMVRVGSILFGKRNV